MLAVVDFEAGPKTRTCLVVFDSRTHSAVLHLERPNYGRGAERWVLDNLPTNVARLVIVNGPMSTMHEGFLQEYGKLASVSRVTPRTELLPITATDFDVCLNVANIVWAQDDARGSVARAA